MQGSYTVMFMKGQLSPELLLLFVLTKVVEKEKDMKSKKICKDCFL